MCQSTGDVDGPVRGVIDGTVSPKELTELYDELRRAQHYRQASVPTPPQKARSKGGRFLELGLRRSQPIGVVEEVLAIEAARREDVVSFRTSCWGAACWPRTRPASVDAWTLEP